MLRVLFFLENTALAGGSRFLLTLVNRVSPDFLEARVLSFGPRPDWISMGVPFVGLENEQAVPSALAGHGYDVIVVSHATLLPMVLPFAASARVVLFCQGYEAFCHGQTYGEAMAPKPLIDELVGLASVQVVTTSLSVQAEVKRHSGKDAYNIPCALDKEVFTPVQDSVRTDTLPRRILMVGRLDQPLKGILDGVAALNILCRDMPVEMVYITPERDSAALLGRCEFPVEIHRRPARGDIADIYRSCAVYCCASWYEGLGLPALEAFHCGIPVVSTRHPGLLEYGLPDENMLVSKPHHPESLYEQLKRVLTDEALAVRLVQNAWATVVQRYDWTVSQEAFMAALSEIMAEGGKTPGGLLTEEDGQRWLMALEAAGLYTPVWVANILQSQSRELNRIMEAVVSGEGLKETDVASLSHFCAVLKPWLKNPRTQYYRVTKAQSDFSAALLGFPEPDFQRLLVSRCRGGF